LSPIDGIVSKLLRNLEVMVSQITMGERVKCE